MFNDKSHSHEKDAFFLREALVEAEKRRGFTSPNPAVGAVLVCNGVAVTKGTHWAAGFPHAEVEALKTREAEPESTLYVTLEPCCHHGKTPPCTDLIIQKKIKRVVFGFSDPNPLVSEKSVELLKAAGIEVQKIDLPEIAAFYRPYFKWTTKKRAWVTGKLALTADEKVSGNDKSPIKITGQQADAYTHQRRKQADVLVTSVKTILSDNPQFNVRLGQQEIKKPLWIIDRQLHFPVQSRAIDTAHSITLIHGKNADTWRKEEFLERGVQLIECDEKMSRLEVESLPRLLSERGIHDAWMECGPTLFSVCLDKSIFDEVIFYQSKKVFAPNSDNHFLRSSSNLTSYYTKANQVLLGDDLQETWFANVKPMD